jgi:hypothetical protein
LEEESMGSVYLREGSKRYWIVQNVLFHDTTTKGGTIAHLAGHSISAHGFYQAWRRARALVSNE